MKTKSLFILLAVILSGLFFSCSKKEKDYKVTIKVSTPDIQTSGDASILKSALR